MMCLATLAASAVYGPARGRDDADQTQIVTATVGDVVADRFGLAGQVFCDGQHCTQIGTAVSVGPSAYADVGTTSVDAPKADLLAVRQLWLSLGHASGVRGWAVLWRMLPRQADPTAALWLTGPVMYVPAVVAAPEDAVGVPGARSRATDEYPLQVNPDWRTLIEQWDDWSPEIMLRILDCESHGAPNAVSPDGRNYGGWQENVIHGYSVEQMTDPVTSTAIAHDIWLSQSYQAWSCY